MSYSAADRVGSDSFESEVNSILGDWAGLPVSVKSDDDLCVVEKDRMRSRPLRSEVLAADDDDDDLAVLGDLLQELG